MVVFAVFYLDYFDCSGNLNKKGDYEMIGRVMILVPALMFVMVYISAAQVVENGLIAYWTFDKANEAGEDIIGGHNAEVFGTPKIVPGKVNEALEFNGTSDYLEADIPHNLLADGVTLEVWFQQDKPNKFGVMIKIDPDKAELNLDPERGGRSELWCFDAGGLEGAAGLSDGNWHHAVGAVSKNGQVHYIDGINVGSNTNAVVFDVPSKVTIGQRAGRGLFWEGMLDEVRVYGRPLSEGEVKQNMEAEGLSVEPVDKLADIWGNIKSQAR